MMCGLLNAVDLIMSRPSSTIWQCPVWTIIPPRSRIVAPQVTISVRQGYTTGASRQRLRPAGEGPVVRHLGPAVWPKERVPRLHPLRYPCGPAWKAPQSDMVRTNVTEMYKPRKCRTACSLAKMSRSRHPCRARASYSLGIFREAVWGLEELMMCMRGCDRP